MSAGRAAMLGRIRQGLGRGPLTPDARTRLEERLAAHAPGPVPARGQLEAAARQRLFQAEAERVSASVARVPSLADVPQAVAEFLARHNLPSILKAAPDERLAAIPWARSSALTVSEGRGEDEDAVSVTAAFAGVAETGTLMLLSGPESPTTLNVLPDTHVAVVRSGDIAGTYEEAWARLRAERAALPRTVNFVTGPSRTADIEQTLLLGAHGPRRLLIVIVDDNEKA